MLDRAFEYIPRKPEETVLYRMIEQRGLEDEADTLVENDPGLAALYASAVRGRIASGPNAGNRVATVGGDRIDGDSLEAMSSPRCAAIGGVTAPRTSSTNRKISWPNWRL